MAAVATIAAVMQRAVPENAAAVSVAAVRRYCRSFAQYSHGSNDSTECFAARSDDTERFDPHYCWAAFQFRR